MKQRDEHEFIQFVRVHRGDLLRWGTHLTVGDQHRAEDLVQQTLTQVYRRWKRARTNPVGYSRRTLTNAFIDDRRRASTRHEVSTEAPPERAWVDQEVRDDHLDAALRSLPPRMRAVVVLRYVDDLSVTDTAAVLGCSEGTVKSQASRALLKLRDALHSTASTPVSMSDAVSGPTPLRIASEGN